MKTQRISRIGLFAACVGCATLASAVRLNGPGNGFDVLRETVTVGGLYYAVGTSFVSPARGRDVLVTCYNVGGGLVWAQFLNGPASGNDAGVAIATGPGGIYVTGSTPSPGGDQDVYTARLNPATGAVLNQTVWGSPANLDDTPADIIVTLAPSVVVVGKTANAANTDALLIGYNPALGLVNANFFNGGNDDAAVAAGSDGVGQIYITGIMENAAGTPLMLIQRWLPGVTIDWAMAVPGAGGGGAMGADIQVTGAGVYVGGSGNRIITGWDAMVVRTPLGGGLAARRFVGTIANDFGVDIEVWAGGQVYLASNFGNDFAMSRMTPALAPIGSTVYAGAGGGVDTCTSMSLDAGTGEVYLAGSALVAGASPDSVVVKFDPFGVQLWATTYDFGGLTDQANDVLFNAGFLFAVGQSEGGTMDALTNRYDPAAGAILF